MPSLFVRKRENGVPGKSTRGEPPHSEAQGQQGGGARLSIPTPPTAKIIIAKSFSIRGANGLFEAGTFERYYRDVRMGTLHAVTAPDLVREEVGKHIFGIPSDVQPRWA